MFQQWCQDQKCVEIEDLPLPVDGGWGNWSEWLVINYYTYFSC